MPERALIIDACIVITFGGEEQLALDSALAFLKACDVGPALLEALAAQGKNLEDLV